MINFLIEKSTRDQTFNRAFVAHHVTKLPPRAVTTNYLRVNIYANKLFNRAVTHYITKLFNRTVIDKQ